MKSLAVPPPNCCYAGDQCEGAPKYADDTIGGVTVYISHPCGNHVQPGKAIVIVPDANGIWHNSRLLADQFSNAGYLTVVCNYWGVVREEGKKKIDETKSSVQSEQHLTTIITWLRSDPQNCYEIGAIGLSEGAIPVMKVISNQNSARARSRLRAAFIATPTENDEFKSSWFASVQVPLSVALADEYDEGKAIDDWRESEKNLKESGSPYQISIYSHVHRGFAVRRAYTTKAEVFAKKQAFIQAITWFQEHLLNGD